MKSRQKRHHLQKATAPVHEAERRGRGRTNTFWPGRFGALRGVKMAGNRRIIRGFSRGTFEGKEKDREEMARRLVAPP